MKSTALRARHEAAGARFGPFAGFELPLSFARGPVEEHRLVRRSAGFFDVDHMGQFEVRGPDSGAALERLVSAPLADLPVGRARYALLLSEAGGVLDDLFVYRRGAESWFVVVNAVNREADFERLRALLPPSVGLEDVSDAVYMLAVQGPRAVALVDSLCSGALSPLPRSAMADAVLAGVPCALGRTGYTGEDGAELFFPAAAAETVWDALAAAAGELGIEAGPVGLAARDSLRFEAGMPLHGHELGPDINPLEAGFGWACGWDHEFVGRAALLAAKAAGPVRKLATITVAGGVPRQGYPVVDAAGRVAGVCVAGLYCPTVDVFAANVFLPPELAAPGTELAVVIRGQAKAAVVAKRPIYVPAYRAARPAAAG